MRSSQPVSAEAGDDLVTVEQVEQEGLRGSAAVEDDGGFAQRGAQPGECLGAVRPQAMTLATMES